MSARASSSPMRGPDLAQLSRRRTRRTQEEALARSLERVRRVAPFRSDALWRVRGAARTSVHMVRTHGRGWQPNGVRRLLPRRRTLRATGTAHVHPHARRATGATGARTEERPTAKTTVCRASGTTTRRAMSARASSSPMRGPDLAQLSRRRTPRIQEEALVGSIAYVASCPVRERRVMATTRASSVYSRVHMVRTYTWPRTETNQRTNQSTCVFSE